MIYGATCIILTGNQKFQREKKNKAGKCLNSKLSLETNFLANHPSALAGQCFSGVVTEGCCCRRCVNANQYCFVKDTKTPEVLPTTYGHHRFLVAIFLGPMILGFFPFI